MSAWVISQEPYGSLKSHIRTKGSITPIAIQDKYDTEELKKKKKPAILENRCLSSPNFYMKADITILH